MTLFCLDVQKNISWKTYSGVYVNQSPDLVVALGIKAVANL